MTSQASVNPWWAALTVWALVNAVNLLQAAGFLSRLRAGDRAINHALGYVILALAVPAAMALFALVRAGASWLHWAGLVVFLLFLALMLVVDYARPVEFRAPPRPGILVPYLALFFSAILLMGLPMFRLDRALWLITIATTALLLGAMVLAMRKGVG